MTDDMIAELTLIKGWINFAASFGLTVSIGAFLIFVFGRDNSLAHRLPKHTSWLLKSALAMCSAGALFNAITFSNPNWSEVCLNVGLCIIFIWAGWFHYMRFVKPWKQGKGYKKARKK